MKIEITEREAARIKAMRSKGYALGFCWGFAVGLVLVIATTLAAISI